MLLKTLFNRVHPVKGFVYTKIQLVHDAKEPNGIRIQARIRPRQGSQGTCSGCGRGGASYDRLEDRCFNFVPLWGIAVVLIYSMRRIDCRRCGVTVERVPWADGKSPMTVAMQVFVAQWARRLSWLEVSEVFWLCWHSVYRAVRSVVEYGLDRRDL